VYLTGIFNRAKMFDFSPDEWLFLALAALVAGVGTWEYWTPIVRPASAHHQRSLRLLMAAWPVAGMALTYVTIQNWGDANVRAHLDYVLLFLVANLAWLHLAGFALGVLGVSPLDDAMDRNNPAAAVASGGGILGAGVIFALSNVGSGPTIWTTLAPASVA